MTEEIGTIRSEINGLRDSAEEMERLIDAIGDDGNRLLDKVAWLERENAKLKELVHDLVMLPSVPAFDCYGCKYEEHHDCMRGCRLVERARELGIEVDE